MALRRLLSGWLIALAALARSVAQALERASEDRSAPTPDPVMAALAERYPGAPAHWLAHVAERTSQLAEAGRAPLSLNSDPAAWPPDRPLSARLDDLPARPTEPEPASRDPRRPPSPSRPDTAVPTLAALRDRSSEVWRRPDVERPRRPRPVFAVVTPAPQTSTPTVERSATEAGVTPRRPRSPLTFVGSPPQAPPSAPELATTATDGPTAKAPPREATWPEPPSVRAATTRLDVQQTAERPPIHHAFAQTGPKQAGPKDAPEDQAETLSDRTGTPPVRRRRSWFFARPTFGRDGRSLELSAIPERRAEVGGAEAERTIAVDPTPPPRAAVQVSTSDHQVAAPERAWRALTPPSRRSIFRALAALRAKPRPRADHSQASEATVVRAAPTIDRPSPRSAQEPPAPPFTPSRAGPSAHTAPAFASVERDAPPSPAEDQKLRHVAHRVVRRASSLPTSTETRVQDNRATFAPPRTASRPASRGFAVSPPDERWPALPPTTFAPPHSVEAPSPRWDVLAREQEEGRWSV